MSGKDRKEKKKVIIERFRYWRCCGCGKWAEKEGEQGVPSHCCKQPWDKTSLTHVDFIIDSMKREGKFDLFTEAVLEDVRRNIKEYLINMEDDFQNTKYRFEKRKWL